MADDKSGGPPENPASPLVRHFGEQGPWAIDRLEHAWTSADGVAVYTDEDTLAGYTPGSTRYTQVAKRAAELAAQGLSNVAIGRQLGTTGHTVRRAIAWHRRNGGAQ